ncbi:MAG: glutathione binding-like protein [Pseudomonadota bacterium]|nr:glutathione binding-like protein [Pseudomonadota bacterium]
MADIVAVVGLDFARLVRYRPPAEFENLHRWFDACRERPAAKAGV